MQQNILAVFDNPNDIPPLVDDLRAAGIPSESIDVVDQKRALELVGEEGQGLGQADQTDQKNIGMFGGFWRWLKDFGVEDKDQHHFAENVRRGGTLVAIRAEDEDVDRIADLLYTHGAVDIDKRAEYYRSAGFNQFDTSAQPFTDEEMIAERERFSPTGAFTIPVVEEDVKVGKRAVNRGAVRITRHVTERPIEETVTLREEHVDVERRPAGGIAEAGALNDLKDEVLEFTETAEEPVVEKQARVTEEVVVKKDVRSRKETVRETARRTDVKVERTDETPR